MTVEYEYLETLDSETSSEEPAKVSFAVWLPIQKKICFPGFLFFHKMLTKNGTLFFHKQQ